MSLCGWLMKTKRNGKNSKGKKEFELEEQYNDGSNNRQKNREFIDTKISEDNLNDDFDKIICDNSKTIRKMRFFSRKHSDKQTNTNKYKSKIFSVFNFSFLLL